MFVCTPGFFIFSKLEDKEYFVTKLDVESITTQYGIKYLPRFTLTNENIPENLLKVLQVDSVQQVIQNFSHPQRVLPSRKTVQKEHISCQQAVAVCSE